MTTITYNPDSYIELKTFTPDIMNQPMIKLVEYHEHAYGVLLLNLKTNNYDSLVVSDNKDSLEVIYFWCTMADQQLTESPVNLMVKLPDDRVMSEVVSRDDAGTLMEKLEIANELHELRNESSIDYATLQLILTLILVVGILLNLIVLLKRLGVI